MRNIKCCRKMVMVLIFALVFSAFPSMSANVKASVVYDVDAAMTYAANHWNDGVGYCAEFVSRCVQAGGVNISVKTGTRQCYNAICNATGLSGIELKLNSSGQATQSLDGDILAAGDVVIQYCKTHSVYPHVLFCAGYNSSGQAVYYAHNAAMNKKTYNLSKNTAYQHTSACTIVGIVIHLSSLKAESTTTTESNGTIESGETYTLTPKNAENMRLDVTNGDSADGTNIQIFENACIRFDMSEYRLEQSDQKLFGAPPGYVGYEGGGQLTNAVKNKPFSVILFDEIEKASPTILDKFLQILEDGRMTDNQGNTVYFGETIIIFTSNIELTKDVAGTEETFGGGIPHRIPTITIEDPVKEDTKEFRKHVTELLTDGVKAYFNDNGRPELLNRLGDDNIVVFQFINVEDAKTICDYKLDKICKTIKMEKNIEIITDEVRDNLRGKAVMERANGGRGVGNMLEREFLKPLAGFICTIPESPSVLRCHNGKNGIEFEVM